MRMILILVIVRNNIRITIVWVCKETVLAATKHHRSTIFSRFDTSSLDFDFRATAQGQPSQPETQAAKVIKEIPASVKDGHALHLLACCL